MTDSITRTKQKKECTSIYLWIVVLNLQSQVPEQGKFLHIENVKKLIKCIWSVGYANVRSIIWIAFRLQGPKLEILSRSSH